MIGVIISNLSELRNYGYHFIESDEGDSMRIEDKDGKTIQTFAVNEAGNIEVRDKDGTLVAESKSVEIFVRFFRGRNLCIKYNNNKATE